MKITGASAAASALAFSLWVRTAQAVCAADFTMYSTTDCSDDGAGACAIEECYGYTQTSDPDTFPSLIFNGMSSDCSSEQLANDIIFAGSSGNNDAGISATSTQFPTGCQNIGGTGSYIDFMYVESSNDGSTSTCSCMRVGGGIVEGGCVTSKGGCTPITCQNGSGQCSS
ncbi:MAG: hypothetical protein M1819_006739 [Sarea resinae]|nr:MAG: hypothetical protein M1819_006739 [Sarea resinae]